MEHSRSFNYPMGVVLCNHQSSPMDLLYDRSGHLRVSSRGRQGFDIQQFMIYLGPSTQGEAVTINIPNTQRYIIARYDTHSGRITMNESVTVKQTIGNGGSSYYTGNIGNRFNGCNTRNTGFFTAGNKRFTRGERFVRHGRRSGSWRPQHCSTTIRYQSISTMDFRGISNQLPVPLRCQRPVCNYAYYCNHQSHAQSSSSSVCRPTYLVDERVFIVERHGRSVRLKHGLDQEAYLAVLKLNNGQRRLVVTQMGQRVPSGTLNFNFVLPLRGVPQSRFNPTQTKTTSALPTTTSEPPPGCTQGPA